MYRYVNNAFIYKRDDKRSFKLSLPLLIHPVFSAGISLYCYIVFHKLLTMAPSAITEVPIHPASNQNGHDKGGKTSYPKPLKLSGALGQFKFEETTPCIGREYLGVDIVDDLLNAENSDERLRDLAITSRLYIAYSFSYL
jgi:hypothetical protein